MSKYIHVINMKYITPNEATK